MEGWVHLKPQLGGQNTMGLSVEYCGILLESNATSPSFTNEFPLYSQIMPVVHVKCVPMLRAVVWSLYVGDDMLSNTFIVRQCSI